MLIAYYDYEIYLHLIFAILSCINVVVRTGVALLRCGAVYLILMFCDGLVVKGRTWQIRIVQFIMEHVSECLGWLLPVQLSLGWV